jgi:hypothetical protein
LPNVKLSTFKLLTTVKMPTSKLPTVTILRRLLKCHHFWGPLSTSVIWVSTKERSTILLNLPDSLLQVLGDNQRRISDW